MSSASSSTVSTPAKPSSSSSSSYSSTASPPQRITSTPSPSSNSSISSQGISSLSITDLSTTSDQGYASAITPTTCPTTPAAGARYITSIFSGSVDGKTEQITQLGYEFSDGTHVFGLNANATTYWYYPLPNGITIVSGKGDSFTYNTNGDFAYIPADFSVEIVGNVGSAYTGKRSYPPKRVAPVSPSIYEVDLNSTNQCNQPAPGLTPKLSCYYSTYGSTEVTQDTPFLNFIENGDGS